MAGVEAELRVHQLQSFNTEIAEITEGTEKNHKRTSNPMVAHTLGFSLLLSVSSVLSVLKAFFGCVWLERHREMI
jgi:hypothetical protein